MSAKKKILVIEDQAPMRRNIALLLEMEGFEERELPGDYVSVDYCLRLRTAEYRVVYTPLAALTHSVSGKEQQVIPSRRAVEQMRSKWGRMLLDDPYYSPNLTRTREDYRVRLE